MANQRMDKKSFAPASPTRRRKAAILATEGGGGAAGSVCIGMGVGGGSLGALRPRRCFIPPSTLVMTLPVAGGNESAAETVETEPVAPPLSIPAAMAGGTVMLA